MAKKIFYVTTEIIPFANVTSIADFSTNVPFLLQEKGHDIRTIIPKYGFISERKYILREVIRLREIPFDFGGDAQVVSAKSAFIPKTRVQIYFLEDDEWFKPLTNLLYKSKNGRTLSDNGERYGYFGKAVLATLPHLFWTPDIFVCNGWQAAFIPGLYKEFYEGKEFYKKIKTVMAIHDFNEYAIMNKSDIELAEIDIPKTSKGDTVNLYEVGAQYADKIVIFDKPSDKISEKLLKLPGIEAHKKKIKIINLKSDESPDYYAVSDKFEQAILKL